MLVIQLAFVVTMLSSGYDAQLVNLWAVPVDQQLCSPNFPNVYPSNANYTWIIRPTPNKCVCVRFTDFDVERNASIHCCPNDWVSIDYGTEINSNNSQKFCGNNDDYGFQDGYNPFIGEICSDEGAMTVNLITNDDINDPDQGSPGPDMSLLSTLSVTASF